MSATHIMANGTLVPGGSVPSVIPDGAVAWQGDRILEIGESSAVKDRFPEARILDAGGGLILPGLINTHHHFYSAMARGLDPGTPMTTFPEVLDRLWWRLDRALDPETIRTSALLSAADCIRWGCTTVFDHHASPGCIEGSLDLIAEALGAAGISGALCYEVTDRNGHDGALAGIEENLRFFRERRNDPRIRGVFGIHASFTVLDETLGHIADRRPKEAGCHIHLAEDPVDAEASVAAFGVDPLVRLEQAGLLDERALLAHGIHLTESDLRTVARTGAALIHNPESNANNGVGRLDVPRVSALGCRVGLGTDGMSSAMLRALRFAFLNLRGAEKDPTAGFEVLPSLLGENSAVARTFFEEPLLGELAPGAPADLIAVDSPPPTPIEEDNLLGHMVYGAAEAPVRHTVARGRVLLEEFEHTTLDPTQLAEEARSLAPGLWQRFHSLDWGTAYLGTEAR
ncbi:MAG: amidohydrolase family protein [Gemmatimonadetes bacterium]|nr:amidohydrolase family protein [Gemmatimonadota bacterium]NNM03705.1 amidohydrolase family protein [Gemmatimonadota bacterium]